MKYVAKIGVLQAEAMEMENILSITEGDCADFDHDAIIKTYSVSFENGFQADIKVCNGNTPYIDNVLFDEQGCEVDCPEISESLLGDYSFEFEGNTYEVTVELSERNERITMYNEKRTGISMFSGDRVEIIGERTVQEESKVLEQYLYHIVGYEAKNGQPFVSLKANIILD